MALAYMAPKKKTSWYTCYWCGWWEWAVPDDPNLSDPFPYPRLCENCWDFFYDIPKQDSPWAKCHRCEVFDWNPYIVEFQQWDSYVVEFPLCRDCRGLVRPPNLVGWEWARCFWCGWWSLDANTLTKICEFCLHKVAMRTKIAIPLLPLDVCANIGYLSLNPNIVPKPKAF